MNLRTLQYFLIAAEEENVTKAAERLFISQQALSIHIKNLEDEYGVAFFERKPVFRLTRAGRRMAEFSRQVLGLEEDVKAEFSDLDVNAKGLLRVGLSRLRSNAFFPAIWEKYHGEHPNISIDLMDGNRQQLSDFLVSGKLDIYIALDVPDNPAWKVDCLYEERSVCIFRRELLQEHYPDSWEAILEGMRRGGVSLPKIAKLPFICTRTDNSLRKNVDQQIPKNVHLNYILESNQQQMICRLSMRGYAAGIVSPAALYMYSMANGGVAKRDGGLCVFPLDRTIDSHKCCLVYRRDWPLPRYAADFVRDAKSSFSEYVQFMQKHFSL